MLVFFFFLTFLTFLQASSFFASNRGSNGFSFYVLELDGAIAQMNVNQTNCQESQPADFVFNTLTGGEKHLV